MKNLLLFIILSAYGTLLFSQETKIQEEKFNHLNSIQLEMGGHGLFYSLSYERIILNGNKFKTAGQFGLSYYPSNTGIRDLWLPFVVNEIFSFRNHHIETGLGIIGIREAKRDMENNPEEWFWSKILTARLGYRYQKPHSRYLFRAGFTPFLELLDDGITNTLHTEFHPSAGIAFGYAF